MKFLAWNWRSHHGRSGPVDRFATKLFARNWCQEWQVLHDRHWSWTSHWCSWELCHHKWPGLHQHEIPASTSMQTSQQSNWAEDLNTFLSSKSWINWQSFLYWGYEGRNAVIFQVDIRSWSFLVCETAKHPRKTGVNGDVLMWQGLQLPACVVLSCFLFNSSLLTTNLWNVARNRLGWGQSNSVWEAWNLIVRCASSKVLFFGGNSYFEYVSRNNSSFSVKLAWNHQRSEHTNLHIFKVARVGHLLFFIPVSKFTKVYKINLQSKATFATSSSFEVRDNLCDFDVPHGWRRPW